MSKQTNKTTEQPNQQQHPTACPHCLVSNLQTPISEQHKKQPTYKICKGCGNIHLTYIPLKHQEEFHQTEQKLNPDGTKKTQIIGVFGK